MFASPDEGFRPRSHSVSGAPVLQFSATIALGGVRHGLAAFTVTHGLMSPLNDPTTTHTTKRKTTTRCSCLRTSSRSMLAVRRIVRVTSGTPLSVHSTSRPGRPGIARSSLVLSMGLARHPHFDARALTGRRFDGERAADRSHTLLDGAVYRG